MENKVLSIFCSECGVKVECLSLGFSKYRDIKTNRIFKGKVCRDCANEKQNKLATRKQNTWRYEKTRKGFLVRAYRNMKSRIEGVQKTKKHLYAGKFLLEKDEFYDWSLRNKNFEKLFRQWEVSSFQRKLTPSVDRIDSSQGYSLKNMEWVTFSENCRRGGKQKKTKVLASS